MKFEDFNFCRTNLERMTRGVKRGRSSVTAVTAHLGTSSYRYQIAVIGSSVTLHYLY